MADEEPKAWAWARDVRMFPSVAAGFIFALTLTLYKDLPDPLRQHLVAGSATYGLGAALVSTIHATLFARAKMRNELLSDRTVTIIFLFHIGLFVLLVAYFLRHGVLS